VLAFVGVGVAYFGFSPSYCPTLLEWIPEYVNVQLRLNETLSIIIKGLVGFAIAFQFPMAVLISGIYGPVDTPNSKKYRKVSIVGMAVLAAVLTPPDPFSMLVMLCRWRYSTSQVYGCLILWSAVRPKMNPHKESTVLCLV
jgi:sec-independent protein translocase protein TatC